MNEIFLKFKNLQVVVNIEINRLFMFINHFLYFVISLYMFANKFGCINANYILKSLFICIYCYNLKIY